MAAHRLPFLDHAGPAAIAHRGGAEEAPENTAAAFQAALDLGYRYLETDAHATADGVLAAFHDDTLDRVTDRGGGIGSLTWDEVGRARVDGQPIPRLDDLLTAWPEARWIIDPKTDAAADLLPGVIERTGAIDRVCVGSFSDRRLARLRGILGPRLCTSMGPWSVLRLRLGSFGLPVGGFDAACVQVSTHWRDRVRIVDRRFLDHARRRNLPVHVWTINDAETMGRLLDLGVDGIMTDRPSLLKSVMAERGLWAPGE